MTDEAGATRTNSVDGLGRLAQVTEGPSAFATSYAYDALDNVTSVTHPADQTHPNGETRAFAYSSMSRLTSATNNTGFLRAERNLLENHRWSYRDGYWYPPSK